MQSITKTNEIVIVDISLEMSLDCPGRTTQVDGWLVFLRARDPAGEGRMQMHDAGRRARAVGELPPPASRVPSEVPPSFATFAQRLQRRAATGTERREC
jgi:hypothetical protein